MYNVRESKYWQEPGRSSRLMICVCLKSESFGHKADFKQKKRNEPSATPSFLLPLTIAQRLPFVNIKCEKVV